MTALISTLQNVHLTHFLTTTSFYYHKRNDHRCHQTHIVYSQVKYWDRPQIDSQLKVCQCISKDVLKMSGTP